MRRTWRTSWIVLLLLAVAVTGVAEDKPNPKQAFLDGKEAGPDFQIQGEYVGKVGDQSFGAQIIARGSGKFDGVIYPGGLPGAGWDTEKKEKHKISGETADGNTKLVGGDFEATIANGSLVLKLKDKSGELKRLHRESPSLGMRAPEGALILFDGSNVDLWTPGKPAETGLMGVGTRTKQVFENYTLHLEFRSPYMPYATGQARGNSGMYLGDQYECQILDSFGLEGEDNECGGIYKNSRPKLNMCLPPLSWQTYDVDFTCAKFDAEGKVTAPAKVTMKHNGVVIHDALELKTTPGGGRSDEKPGAIFLQDHGDPVRFRNIWVVEKK
jgi:3-keto-disaccharide hydrolase